MQSYIYQVLKSISNRDNLYIYFEDQVFPKSKVIDRIYKYRQFFLDHKIHDSSRVVVISKNRPYFIFTVFGLLSIGAIPVLIEDSQEETDIIELIKDEDFIITDRKLKYSGKNIYSFEEIEKEIKSYKDKISLKDEISEVEPDRTVIILHSSGTTGLPKKVHYSESNIDWAMKEYTKLYEVGSDDIFGYVIPVNCCLGIIACCLLPMLHGNAIVMMDENDLDKALDAISERKVSILPGTPYLYKYMVHKNLNEYDFTTLRLCDSGGEILPIAIINKFKEGSGVTITEGYGQTETTSLTHFLYPDKKGKLRLGSIGAPCTDLKCKIVKQDGQEADRLEVGELHVKGPMVMKGYDNKELNDKSLDKDGYFITGDIVYKDKDDYYYLVSRKKDLNNTNESNAVHLRDIEEKLYGLDEVIEATTLIDANSQVQIFIKPTASSKEGLDDIFAKCKEVLSNNPLNIIDIKFVNQIPRTATGKVKRRLM